MKKTKNKKILTLMPIFAFVIAIPSAFTVYGIANANEDSISNISRSTASLEKVLDVDQVTKDFLSQPGVVTKRTFYGDISKATSKNDFNNINIDLLKDAETGNVEKAYKTLTDNYTPNVEEAKKSYLKNPIIKWTDKNGNYFDSEYEAKDAMLNKAEQFTNPVAYYEVKDYSNVDSLGNPAIVKINPFSKKDLEALKNIAIRNMLKDNSDFSIQRMSTKSSNLFIFDDYQGKSTEVISSEVNRITQGLTNIIKKNLWINVDVTPVADRPQIALKYIDGGGWTHTGIAEFYFDKHNNVDPSVIGSDYQNIINDSHFLTNYDSLKQKFDVHYDKFGTAGWTPAAHITTKGNQNIFGGQSFNVRMRNDYKILKKFSHSIGNGAVDFAGKGNLVNVYFDLSFNQNKLQDKLHNDTAFHQMLTSKAAYVKEEAFKYLKVELIKVGYTDAEASDLATSFAEESQKLILEDVIGNEVLKANSIKSSEQTRIALDKLDSIILNKLNSNLLVNSKPSVNDSFRSILTKKYQTQETVDSNEVIYTINYNGQPLFKFENQYISKLYSNELFKRHPLAAVKESMHDGLNNGNYDAFVTELKSKLVNVSNSVDLRNANNNGLTKNSIDNINNQNNKAFKLTSVNNNNTNGFDADIHLINEDIYSTNGVNKESLQMSLKRREDDSIGFLQSNFGAFESMYQYNKSLIETLNTKNPSDALKMSVRNNAVTSNSDIIVLFDKDKTMATVKYGEYLNYGFKFNEGLADGKIKVLSSMEKRAYEIGAEGLNVPSKYYTYFDYDGNVLLSAVVDQVDGSYDAAANQVYQNALNKINVPASNEFIYYSSANGERELVKNEISNIYVLKITPKTSLRNEKSYYYGFTKYQDMFNYAKEYITISSDANPDISIPSDPSKPIVTNRLDAMWSGVITSISLIAISEIIFFITLFIMINRNEFNSNARIKQLVKKINKESKKANKKAGTTNINTKPKLNII